MFQLNAVGDMDDDRPLRVCHLGKYYPPAAGGIETHVQTLAQSQAALGLQVSVICADHEGIKRDGEGKRVSICRERDGDVRVTRCARRFHVNRLDVCPSLPGVLRDLSIDPPDLLHLHTPNPMMLLALTIVRPEIPLVVTHHSDVIRQKLLKFALRPFERFIYSRAAGVLTTSVIYRFGSSFLSRYAEKIHPLPLGVDLSPYTHPSQAAQAYAADMRAAGPGPMWLCVGRLVYYKAFHLAIRALAKSPGRLVIIGSGPLEAELRELAQRVGVADRIVWKGYVSRDELIGAYHAADALWFPSNARSEAFGLVQVEAMASGCPVINTHIAGSGVPWVSQHEVSGLTIPTDDADALATAAKVLLNDPKLHRSLRHGARLRAENEFGHMTMARRSVEIYHRALGRAAMPAEVEEPQFAGERFIGRPTRADAVSPLGV